MAVALAGQRGKVAAGWNSLVQQRRQPSSCGRGRGSHCPFQRVETSRGII
jgi:hypothetical protein